VRRGEGSSIFSKIRHYTFCTDEKVKKKTNKFNILKFQVRSDNTFYFI